MQKLYHLFAKIGRFLLRLLWHLLHVIVSVWCLALGIIDVFESYLISFGLIKKYKSLNIQKLQYLAIVVESEEAYQTLKIIKLLQWLATIGIKHVCLYDSEGILKKSKEMILKKLNDAKSFEETHANDFLLDQKYMVVEFTSFSDGKEMVVKAANVLFMKYLKLGAFEKNQEDQFFTEAHLSEALKALGCRGPDPDLLLIYGPARCHLGFPAWRLRYTEIVHMAPLRSMRYGSLLKAIHKYTMVNQNFGK